MSRTTLVVHQAALGDSILLLPLLKRLANDGPLFVAMPLSKARLLQRLLPDIVPLDIETQFWTRLHSDSPSLLACPLPETCLPIDRIISFVSNGQDTWATHIRTIGPEAQCYFISPNPPATWTGHVTDWHDHQLPPLAPLAPLPPLPHPPIPPQLCQPSGGTIRLDPAHWRQNIILIHPGSGGQAKCWPIEQYRQLIHRLMQDRFSVQVIFGEAESHRLDRLTFPCDTRLLTDLDQLADAIASASFFIGNDSGPTHLAAQMGLPTLALFGPSRCDHWHPIGPNATWLCPPEPCPIDWLSVDQVYDAVIPHTRLFE